MPLDRFSADINCLFHWLQHTYDNLWFLQIYFLKWDLGSDKDVRTINVIEVNGTNVLKSQECFLRLQFQVHGNNNYLCFHPANFTSEKGNGLWHFRCLSIFLNLYWLIPAQTKLKHYARTAASAVFQHRKSWEMLILLSKSQSKGVLK